jgi:hypothetical protein
MTLKEYLKQKNPVRMPIVTLKKKEYSIASTGMYGRLRDEKRSRCWINSADPLLAGTEYCLIGTTLWTVDRDGNPKNRSCFRIEI